MILLRRSISIVAVALLVTSAYAQTPSTSSSTQSAALRLRDVKAVYVESFGVGPGAGLIRAEVITSLAKSGRLEVVESPENANAILSGTGEVWKSQEYLYSANPQGAMGQGKTKEHASAAVRLVSQAGGKILWADQASDAVMTLHSAASSAADGIVKKMLAAIEKDKL
jgi:hypothetical protein